jgi:pimeloyl-ACP methyl ester carboxylesterase
MYRVAAVPPRLVKTLSDRDRAVLEEGIRIILPVSARFRGIVNDAKTQSGDEPLYPLDRVDAPALILSAEDDLYQTLSVARRMAAQMPKARLLEYRTGGHFLIGRSAEVWPEVAGFLRSHSAVETAVSRAVPVPPRRGERRYG